MPTQGTSRSGVGVPGLDVAASFADATVELVARLDHRQGWRLVGGLERRELALGQPALGQQPQLVGDLPRRIGIDIPCAAVLPGSAEVGGGGEPVPDRSREAMGIERFAERRCIANRVVGDGGEPGIAAVDDAPLGIPDRRGAARRGSAPWRGCLAGALGHERGGLAEQLLAGGGIDGTEPVDRHLERRLAIGPVIRLARCRDGSRTPRTAGRGRAPPRPAPTSSRMAARSGRPAGASARGRPGPASGRAAPRRARRRRGRGRDRGCRCRCRPASRS